MAQVRYDSDANSKVIGAKRVAVLGFGSQGHAHALNLHDSGVDVCVGLRPGSQSVAVAEAAGLPVFDVATAVKRSQVVMVLLPDTVQAQVYTDAIEPNLEAGDTLMFAHGFNIRYGTITAPEGVDVSMVAPKGPGHRVRETFEAGEGVPALLAVHQDASGHADELALSYAQALGSARAGVLTTSFAEETETDLFGEQAVLCGGVSELVKAGFETLVEAGYQPEIAYFECLHELKLIVDLMYRGGLNYMRYSVSDTAEYGDYVSGGRVISEHTREAMREVLADVQSGQFAKQWIREGEQGEGQFRARRASEKGHQLEEVGARLRAMMPFVQPPAVG
jgi:ketol-acid reductoisomerase